MQYLSTRGGSAPLQFEDVLLEGLARDGGLFVPDAWPHFSPDDIAALVGLPYARIAQRIVTPFLGGAVDPDAFGRILDDAYATFRHPDIAPVVPLANVSENLHLMELFHGPTLAFKDVAMQVLGGLFEHVLEKRRQRVTIIGATSGDTGSAAIEAVAGRRRASVFILHPRGRTSEVQRRQMTTVLADNVFNLAIEGTFDDCQDLLKAMFNDAAFRDEVGMSGVNSINWARLMPQIVYYFTAALALHGKDAGTQPTSFSVPTGNFGDVYAGYAAARMGLPIHRLVIASNQNDILTRVMTTGEHRLGEVAHTLSPSMDIQVSSNFERLLFDMFGRDGARVATLMHELKTTGGFTVPAEALDTVRHLFAAHRVDEDATLNTMRRVHAACDMLIDPHTAVGVAAALSEQGTGNSKQGIVNRAQEAGAGEQGKGSVQRSPFPAASAVPMVVLGTAHPAKFPDAVEKATGRRPPLPAFLSDLYDREERCDVLPNDLAAVQAHIKQRVQRVS